MEETLDIFIRKKRLWRRIGLQLAEKIAIINPQAAGEEYALVHLRRFYGRSKIWNFSFQRERRGSRRESFPFLIIKKRNFLPEGGRSIIFQ